MAITGRYRFRKGLRGVQILQVEHSGPMLIGGTVDASMRQRSWSDASDPQAQDVLDILNLHQQVGAVDKSRNLESCRQRFSEAKQACPIDVVKATGGWFCMRCDKRWKPGVIPFEDRVCGKRESSGGGGIRL